MLKSSAMKITSKAFLMLFLFFVMACNDTKPAHTVKKTINKSVVSKGQTAEDVQLEEKANAFLQPYQETFGGYTFKFGYEQYDEEKFGFANPGYLKVFNGDKLIFKDKFEGEGQVSVKSLGYHYLSGRKLVFELHYGTQACDYSQTSRYYVVELGGKIHFLKDSWSGTGGDHYASRYYKTIFPGDTLGAANTFKIVEGMVFHEHDQPDVADTTYITFEGNKFRINKPTDNLGKVE